MRCSLSHFKKTITFGNHQLTLETGEIARQSTGAVLVSLDDTVVLVTVVGRKDAKPEQDFFPLTVDYQEKTYAAGKIPGSFFKREGRPSEKEVLTSRLIDRPLRPLFPEGFYNEVQIVATVMSSDSEIDSDIPSLIGASAALAISGIPFDGPIGAARVGYANGEYLLNPTATELKTSQMDLVVAGTDRAVLMVESEAQQLSEEVMLGAVMFGHAQFQVVIDAINEMVDAVGKDAWDWTPPTKDETLVAQMNQLAEELIRQDGVVLEVERGLAGEHLRDVGGHGGLMLGGEEGRHVIKANRTFTRRLVEPLRRAIPGEDPVIGGEADDDAAGGVNDRTEHAAIVSKSCGPA